jgi:hypothetical protein
MTVMQITGGWGKTSLIASDRTAPDENRRRHDLVAEVVDFVLLNSGGNGLAITYQDLEDRFARVGIRTGHFNAISGLDSFGDVQSLFVIGRPLPAPGELLTMARALTGRAIAPEDGHVESRGVLMADGTGAALNVRVYAEPTLEALRAAITDAEVIQAIGRGRGVNRDGNSPLSVFVFADVVLPLPVARLVRWVDIRPDVIGRMIARGVALFSPADAAKAYPDLFRSPDAARMALKRAAAERQSIRTFPYGYLFIGECRFLESGYAATGFGSQAHPLRSRYFQSPASRHAIGQTPGSKRSRWRHRAAFSKACWQSVASTFGLVIEKPRVKGVARGRSRDTSPCPAPIQRMRSRKSECGAGIYDRRRHAQRAPEFLLGGNYLPSPRPSRSGLSSSAEGIARL